MENTTEKKLPVRNLERICEATATSYEGARFLTQVGDPGGKVKNFDQFDKVKIFARSNGIFDVVWYRKIKRAEEKSAEKTDQKAKNPKHKRNPQPKA
jgi:hypothetical protein